MPLLDLLPLLTYNVFLPTSSTLQPTVGEACEKYHQLPLKTRGLYITLHDRGNVLKKLQAWHTQDIKVTVITDGERILGLGECQAEHTKLTVLWN